MFNEGVSPSKLTGAPNYGSRVPVDTTPGPVPVYRALKNPPLNSWAARNEFSHQVQPAPVNSHHQHNRDIGFRVHRQMRNLHGQRDHGMSLCVTTGKMTTWKQGRRPPEIEQQLGNLFDLLKSLASAE